jgi:cobalamin synthase
MPLIVFWTLATMQVAMSIFIHFRSASKDGRATLPLRIGQQKDDLLSCVVMAIAASSQSFKAAGIIYLVATVALVWLGRRARARLDLLRRQ